MKVVPQSELPTRAPTLLTAVVYLLCDRLHAAPAVWGALGVVLLFAWISFFVTLYKQEQTPVRFEPKERP